VLVEGMILTEPGVDAHDQVGPGGLSTFSCRGKTYHSRPRRARISRFLRDRCQFLG
jgi:hypothetical protein